MLNLKTVAFVCAALAFNTTALASINDGLFAYYKFNGDAKEVVLNSE
jgi:hypothetical protein